MAEQSPEINPCIIWSNDFDKSIKAIHWGRRMFSTNDDEKIAYPYRKVGSWTHR